MASRVSVKSVNYGKRPRVNSVSSRIWAYPHKPKEVPVKDSKLPKPAEKQSTLHARDTAKTKRDSAKYDKEPAAVKVKRRTAWSKR